MTGTSESFNTHYEHLLDTGHKVLAAEEVERDKGGLKWSTEDM